MHWRRVALHSWAACGLVLLVGLWLWYGTPEPPLPRDVVLGLWLLVAGWTLCWTLLMTARALEYAVRRGPSRERLPELVAGLDSPLPSEQAVAVEGLARFYGEPFGPVDYGRCTRSQLQALRVLYKEYWRANRGEPPSPLQRRLAALCERAVGRERDLQQDRRRGRRVKELLAPRSEDLARLPVLRCEPFASRMRPSLEEALARVVAAVNRVGRSLDLDVSEEWVCDLFAELRAEALEEAWAMRFNAEYGRGPEVPADAAPRPAAHPPAPPPVPWAERYRQMAVTSPPPSAPSSVGVTQPADAPVPSLTWGQLAAALHHKVDEALDHMADVIKDAMLDGEIPCPTPGDETDSPPAQTGRSPIPREPVQFQQPEANDPRAEPSRLAEDFPTLEELLKHYSMEQILYGIHIKLEDGEEVSYVSTAQPPDAEAGPTAPAAPPDPGTR